MRLGLAAIVGLTFSALVHGQSPAGQNADRAEVHAPDAVKWQPGPASLPKGAMIAVLEGDPARDGPFVFRVKLPDGYRVAPHSHPKVERVTVLAGTLFVGFGDRFDAKKAHSMPAGSFGRWPPGMRHFAWTEGETILQIHGTGPWSMQYVNPADDPRNQKK